MKILAKVVVALLMPFGIAAIGCSSQSAQKPAEPAHEEHGHASTGPHKGDLIELGNEEYHAELTHENEAVVYILDGSAKAAVAIDAKEVVVNVTHDGKAEQFALAASRNAQDPEGKASRFVSSDAELVSDLEEGHAEVQLVVTINGAQLRGNLEHDHEGHDH